ncbi:MAG: hypothetical protein JSS34_08080 [Proteobacteria bacterium]|nr:hypothetical protein [Pseudomonadota bacterium]
MKTKIKIKQVFIAFIFFMGSVLFLGGSDTAFGKSCKDLNTDLQKLRTQYKQEIAFLNTHKNDPKSQDVVKAVEHNLKVTTSKFGTFYKHYRKQACTPKLAPLHESPAG